MPRYRSGSLAALQFDAKAVILVACGIPQGNPCVPGPAGRNMDASKGLKPVNVGKGGRDFYFGIALGTFGGIGGNLMAAGMERGSDFGPWVLILVGFGIVVSAFLVAAGYALSR